MGRLGVPERAIRMVDIPITVSKRGESEGREHVLPDPGVIEDKGRVILFQSEARSEGIGESHFGCFGPIAGPLAVKLQ